MENTVVVVVVFVVGYLLIAFEKPLRVNKTASALLTGVVCWTVFMFSSSSEVILSGMTFTNYVAELKMAGLEKFSALSQIGLFRGFVVHELSEHLSKTSEILFFLLGAMTIVELIDAHHGFRFITGMIRVRSPKGLLWIVSLMTFFLSAVLDNLTSTIVMVSLIRKLIPDQRTRLLFVGMIIIAANAGGAWSPIGDVTTTMLWNGGFITPVHVMQKLIIPSLVSLLVPLIYITFALGKNIDYPDERQPKDHDQRIKGGKIILVLGLLIMLGIPVFKLLTNLPPYVGMIAGLGILWIVSELIHPELDEAMKKNYTAAGALSRIDVPSILFFLGILLAVSAMESMQILHHLSETLTAYFKDHSVIISLLGLLSAVIDNVPLVAACMGMYGQQFPVDHFAWEYIAYCTGTGGSILIIGSAAGVAAMGMEKIDFIWYLKKFSLPALLGYVAGAGVYLWMN
jgi:Na+/H+ antiporter NhaD/arsenite permease-like protein